jgi:rhamnosyltransferase
MPTVDILLPTYNGERYIKEQIISLLEQTHLNIRIYIRDDRSTDGTVSIIENLSSKDSRITIIKENNINLGLVGNINYLLSKSEADYIMYCDQDDVWFKDKVEVLLKEILHHEKEFGKKFPLLVHSDCFVTDESLVVKGLFKRDKPLTYGLAKSLFKYYVQGASTIFNSSLKEQIYPFIENVYLHDRYTHLVAEIMGRRFYLNKPLMYYRQHTNNLVGSSSFLKKIKNNLCVKNLTYFHLKDKLLITALLKDKFPQNKLLKDYLKITSSKISRIKKIKIIFSNQIAMRFKEFIILTIKN